MTDEECARRVSAIRSEARQRVPEWEPWMTVERGYAGLGRHWVRDAEARDSQQAERDRAYKERQQRRDRARYLRRAADPEAYERYLAEARAKQAVRDAAKRAGKTELAGGGRGFDTFARLQELPASGTVHVHGAEGRYPARHQQPTRRSYADVD